MSSYLTSAKLQHFLDEMNYISTQTDLAYLNTQYCDSTHINLLTEVHFKFPNPDPA